MPRFSFREPPVWLLAGVLMVVLLPALLLNNYHYFFRYNLYEFEDLAADSLQILKAKSFHEIHGQYSRWGFHHPGPAFFYVQAWGEMLFYDWWHLVPRPLNAQMLATVGLNVFFLGVALATATRWVGMGTVFLPLALGLGVLQIAAISLYGPEFSALMLFGNWPGYFLVVPFAAFLVVLASVAAGRGESLPFAALTGCFLAHGHIVQAVLFVVPLSALAYLGLLLAGRTGGAPPGAPESPGSRRAFLTRPWQRFPRAHVLAVLIVAVFLWPILIDLSRGSQSNLAQIIAVRRAMAGEPHKSLVRSLFYFLQYGTDDWYQRSSNGFEHYTASGMWEYLSRTRAVWELRAVGTLGALVVMASWLRRTKPPADAPPDPAAVRMAGRRRYTVWLAVFTGAAVVITLVWGCVMNGDMYYLNAYFNFGLYYVGALVVAAAAADYLCTAMSPGWNPGGLGWFLYATVGLLAAFNAGSFRLTKYAHSPQLAAVAAHVAGALRDDPPGAPRARYLAFPPGETALAVDVAVLLERAGHPFFAPREWQNFLGADRCPDEPVSPAQAAQGVRPFLCWRILPESDVPIGVDARPLTNDSVLLTSPGTIDPAADDEILFGNPYGNDAVYTAFGWSGPEETGVVGRWSGARQSLLGFRARPVLAGTVVRMVLDCHPFVFKDKKPSQRIGLNFNGTELGEWRRDRVEPIEVTIPAAVWNAREDAWLLLRFPDAATPVSLGFNTDTRMVAFAFQRIKFRVEPGNAGPP